MDKLNLQIQKNSERMNSQLYTIESVFKDRDYGWQGDWEGRALLAFVCHYKISGEEIPCMKQMIDLIPKKTNGKGFFGEVDKLVADEQQLSGHGWYLRGLAEYYDCFKDERAIDYAKKTVEALFLPILDKYENYPREEQRQIGGVSGNSLQVIDGWRLSSDVGCAFIPLDGLSRYYEITNDQRVEVLLKVMIDKFSQIDKIKANMQTHATLSGVRGILRFYRSTGDKRYLKIAIEHFDLYLRYGMTLNYENYNWFGRENTWTEPCAVVDSLIVSKWLYEITKEEKYLTLFRRIYFNGLFFCQRENGGAGTNVCTTKENPILKTSEIYEAPFCCSMRYAEGLMVLNENRKLVEFDESKPIIEDEIGRLFIDDRMLVKDLSGILKNEKKYLYKGEEFCFIPSLITVSGENAVKLALKVIIN